MAPNRPFPIEPVMTAVAVGYRNPAISYIGGRVLPPLPVLAEQFKWTEYPLSEHFTVPDTLVARKGQPNQVEFTGIERPGSVNDYGLDDLIPYSDIRAAEQARAERRSNINPELLATSGLANLLAIAREVRVANLVQNADNYSAGRKTTLVGTSQFSDLDDSDPVGVIDDAINGTLVYRANIFWAGYPVWNVLKKAPKLVKAVKGTTQGDGFITKREFAEFFELNPENVLIGEAWLNTAKKGQAVNLGRVWGKNCGALYVDPSKQSATDTVISYGFTAEYGSRVAGSIEDEDVGLGGGKRVRVGESVGEFVAARDCGYLIKDAVA